MQIVSCGVYAYCLNMVGMIIERMFKNEQVLQHKLLETKYYMQELNISKKLQIMVQRYVEAMHEEDKTRQRHDLLFSLISKQLRDDLLVDKNFKIINSIGILNLTFSTEFLKRLCLYVQQTTFAPEDVIYQVGLFLAKSAERRRLLLHPQRKR